MKFTLEELISHVEKSVQNAENNFSKINNDILSLEGYSGKKTRHLYNNLCSLADANYLEIGTWKGSSFVSSIYDNISLNALAIDNWSEFGGPKEEFLNNVKKFVSPAQNWNFFEKDCFSITAEEINKYFNSVDIYLYDGAHDFSSHERAITHFYKFLSKYSIIVIDDWRHILEQDGTIHSNWSQVIFGTSQGLSSSSLIIHKYVQKVPEKYPLDPDGWWNGTLILVCERNDI